jgi:hypothetical protein
VLVAFSSDCEALLVEAAIPLPPYAAAPAPDAPDAAANK